MTNYTDIFNARGGSYVDAHDLAPKARDEEAGHLLSRMNLETARRIGDAPAGGGFVADEVQKWRRMNDQSDRPAVTCIEPSASFAARISDAHQVVGAPLAKTALPEASFDCVGSLAGLHHFEDKSPFFHEMHRVLEPGGRLAVADVKSNTHVAGFLNDSVDRYTETGHDGMFFTDGEFTSLIEEAGFTDATERYEEFYWRFPSEEIMVAYCQGLFGLVKATPDQAADEIHRYFSVVKTEDGVALPWALIYATGVKTE